MTTHTAQTHDKNQIRQLISNQMSAICAKDMDRLMSYYATEAIVFDVKSPFQAKNANEFRRVWETCLSCFPVSLGTEIRDLGIFVSGDLALAHWFWRFIEAEKDHPAMQVWIRSSAGYQRSQGKWLIAFEHCTVPFEPQTSKVKPYLVSNFSPIQWQEPSLTALLNFNAVPE